MERIAARPAAINMRINAAPRVSSPRAETFRSIKTGESIKLGIFSPQVQSLRAEQPVRRFNTINTISFAAVVDKAKAPVVVTDQLTRSTTEFGRFVPNAKELNFVKPPKKVGVLPVFDTTIFTQPEKPETKNIDRNSQEQRDIVPRLNGDKKVIAQTNSINDSYTKYVSNQRLVAIRTELQALSEKPEKKEITIKQQPKETNLPLSVKKKDNVETVDQEVLQQKITLLYKEKGLVGALQQLKTEGATVSEITLLRAVHVVVEQQVKEQRMLQLKGIVQPEVIKKKDQEVFLTYRMVPPEKKTMNEETKQQIVIDEKVMVARQLVVIGAVLQRYLFQEIVSGNAEYILSGKDLASDLPQKATDNLISGLAAMRGTEDGSYEMWKQKIAALPQSNMFDIMTSAVGLISTALPVTVAESGKKASPDAISLVLGLTPLTDITTR